MLASTGVIGKRIKMVRGSCARVELDAFWVEGVSVAGRRMKRGVAPVDAQEPREPGLSSSASGCQASPSPGLRMRWAWDAPQEELLGAIPNAVSSLARGEKAAELTALGITTTDLAYKSTAMTLQLGGREVRLGGCVKGSGMIHPNMATMLGVVTCDAAVEPLLWRQMVTEASTQSFNQVSIYIDSLVSSTAPASQSRHSVASTTPTACPSRAR
jgi:hypothetical protein